MKKSARIAVSSLVALYFILTALYQTKNAAIIEYPLPWGSVLYAIEDDIQSIYKDDHLRQEHNSDSIYIIEYSDYTCYFCREVRDVFQRFEKAYPTVNFIYRHNPNARRKDAFRYAKSAECVNRIAGKEAFWNFTNEVFQNQPLTEKNVRLIALRNGLTVQEYERCLEYPVIEKRVMRDVLEAERVHIPGTPFILIIKDHQVVQTSYALPYDAFENLVIQAVGIDALKGGNSNNE